MSIETRFKAFHLANPHIIGGLEEIATEWFAAGNDRASIKMLWEVLRWREGTTTTGDEDGFLLNNNFHSRYGRLLLDRNPEWAPRFRTRELRAA